MVVWTNTPSAPRVSPARFVALYAIMGGPRRHVICRVLNQVNRRRWKADRGATRAC
jgi:hypothetical protein